MKLNKSTFKAVVKECLLEILSEGLASTSSNKHINENRRVRQKESSRKRSKKPKYLDGIDERQEYNANANQKIKKLTSGITKDPIMQEILSDTASTTLQEQISADRNKTSQPVINPNDKVAKVVNESNPDELFGAASKNWATLAFS
jgi:hypothetical protein